MIREDFLIIERTYGNLQIEGTFVRKEGHIFRTEAKLQWGDSDEKLGLIIMLNPGKSRLEDKKRWNLFCKGNLESVKGELKKDQTMIQVISILEKAHPCLNGIVTIKNLFNLREPNSDTALQLYADHQQLPGFKELFYDDFTDLSTYPWVWIGWSLLAHPLLDQRKWDLLNKLLPRQVCFALYSSAVKADRIQIKHPNPRNPNQKKEYTAKMVEQMQSYFFTLCHRCYLRSASFQILCEECCENPHTWALKLDDK